MQVQREYHSHQLILQRPPLRGISTDWGCVLMWQETISFGIHEHTTQVSITMPWLVLHKGVSKSCLTKHGQNTSKYPQPLVQKKHFNNMGLHWFQVLRSFPTDFGDLHPPWPGIFAHISPKIHHLLAQELSSNFGQCHEGHCNAYRQHQ